MSSSAEGRVLRLLSDGEPRTRATIGDELSLPRAAVTSRVDLLMSTGLVVEYAVAPSSGGRPPARLAFNRGARVVLAVDLGATHGSVAVADLAGEPLLAETVELDIQLGPVAILDLVVEIARRLLDALDRLPSEVLGIGIGVPGPVEHASGRPVKPPIMPGWDRFDIPGHLASSFPVPVLVDNDVNLLALGELAIERPGCADLFFVKVSTGIGAGIISGGALQRGALGAAGDLGHVQVPWTGADPAEREDGDLEAIASGPAIARHLRERGVDAASSADVVTLLEIGNPDAVALTRAAGRDIGEVVATCVNLLNPSVIVVGGSIARAGQEVLAGIREVVYRRSLPLATQSLEIVQSRLGPDGGLRGAAIMTLGHLFAEDRVDALIAAVREGSPSR